MYKVCYVVTIPETIEAFFIPQLRFLSENGFSVFVVCSKDDILQAQLGEKVNYVPIEIPRGGSLIGSIRAVRDLTSFFSKNKFDIIQYSTPNAAFYASIAAKLTGCKVRNYHLMGLRYLGASGINRTILKTIEKVTCKNSTSIECVSKSNLKIGLDEKIFAKEKATVVWNGSTGGIDLSRFDVKKRAKYSQEIRRQYGISRSKFVFGFVGRITKDKGINEILEAFKQVQDTELMMVGSTEGINTLNPQLYQESLCNPNIIYTGNMMYVEKYYAALDVLLLPSYREGFGNVVIEAAAMGTPAIVSNIPGPIDAVERDVTALVVEPKDVQSLVNAMKKILEMDYVSMGMKAREFAIGRFDNETLCEKILERKMSLLGEK